MSTRRDLIVKNSIIVVGEVPTDKIESFDSGFGNIRVGSTLFKDYNWAITFLRTDYSDVFFVVYIWKDGQEKAT